MITHKDKGQIQNEKPFNFLFIRQIILNSKKDEIDNENNFFMMQV